MNVEIRQAGRTDEVALPSGRIRVGGDRDDNLRIEGLPASLLELTIHDSQVWLCASQTLAIDQALFPASVPRLLFPGERVRLAADVDISVVRSATSPSLQATAYVARQLLVGSSPP